jgi:hypothetical protein
MPEKKKQEYDDPEQSARFVELANKIQAEDAEERFEEAMKKVAQAKRPAKYHAVPESFPQDDV